MTVRLLILVLGITHLLPREAVAAPDDPAARPEPEIGVAYDPAAPDDADRAYDWFPPRRPGASVAVFVHSRFWSERSPDPLVLGGLVKGLVRAGHGVAVVRHRTGADAVHPGPIRDVARAFAHVHARLVRDGADPSRLFLVGHSSGAQLALLLGLDPRWLAEHALTPDAIAGIAALSGILDLADAAIGSDEERAYYAKAFPSAVAREQASPSARVDTARPPILLLTAARDIPGYALAARDFVARARRSGTGAVERFVSAGRDHFTILDVAREGGEPHLLHFLESRPRAGDLPEMWQVAATWRDPPFSTEPFHDRFAALVREYEADAKFTTVVNRPFRAPPDAPPRLRFGRYAAIELTALLDAMAADPDRAGAVGRGDFLVATNVRGEKFYLPMARIRELAPRLVVGVDGEKDLFRATDVYHTRRRYSWVDAEARRVDMARPLGAFLFFPGEEPTRSESLSLFGRYGHTVDSFRLERGDPRDAYADLPDFGREVLTERHQCVSCHRFREVGGRALHIRARDGARMGGHALPLERYPDVVWKRFVYDQVAVAEEVGANAVAFTEREADALYRMVVAERERRGVKPWIRPDRDRDREADPPGVLSAER